MFIEAEHLPYHGGWLPLGGETSDSHLSSEVLLNDSGVLSPITQAHNHLGPPRGGSSSGSSSGTTPAPTLVGAAGGLRFDLIWDSSVALAPAGFVQDIDSAAQYLSTLFSTPEVVNIHVGYGEINGSPLASGALGESESVGVLTNFSTVTGALEKDGYAFAASNEPSGSQFYVANAEAKAFGLISPSSTAVDGFVGFSSTYPMYYGSSGPVPSNQYDLYSIAEHEITEVMGRIELEGANYAGLATYTPLDLFNYHATTRRLSADRTASSCIPRCRSRRSSR